MEPFLSFLHHLGFVVSVQIPCPSQQKTAQWYATVLLANCAPCWFSYPIFHKHLDLLKFKINKELKQGEAKQICTMLI